MASSFAKRAHVFRRPRVAVIRLVPTRTATHKEAARNSAAAIVRQRSGSPTIRADPRARFVVASAGSSVARIYAHEIEFGQDVDACRSRQVNHPQVPVLLFRLTDKNIRTRWRSLLSADCTLDAHPTYFGLTETSAAYSARKRTRHVARALSRPGFHSPGGVA